MNSLGQFREIWCRIDTARKDPLLKRFVLHPLPLQLYRLVLSHQTGLLVVLIVSSSMLKQQHLECFAGYISAFVCSHNTPQFLPMLTASFPFNRVCAASLFWVNILCVFLKKTVSLFLKKQLESPNSKCSWVDFQQLKFFTISNSIYLEEEGTRGCIMQIILHLL